MITKLILNKYIKSEDDKRNEKVREQIGKISSLIGIGINLVLCAGKIAAGILFGSISITADGINNLSDAGNSLISFISFKLSSRPADEDHPFGHERYEYVASMIVGVSVLLLGIELIRSSFTKILNPEAVEFSMIAVFVLVASILAKCWMFFFNRKIGKEINSSVMEATAIDSLSDCISTSGVLVSLILSQVINFQLDGYMGVIVALFILVAGVNILKEAVNKILGSAPEYEVVKYIEEKVKSYDGVLGIHDLMIHNYGPNRCFASVHVEVDSKVDVLISHDLIDNIELDFLRNDNIHLVIHLDPIVVDNPVINELYSFMKKVIADIDSSLQMHDFRAVLGETHSNLIFDLCVPYSCELDVDEIQSCINAQLAKRPEKLFTVIQFERPYIK